MSYLQAVVIGLLQGVTELFPVSSLGHSVLVPAWLGWDSLLHSQGTDQSFFLAFLVGLHLATAIALIGFFWRDWVAIGRGLVTSIRHRCADTPAERMAWLLILATIPVGVVGLVFEHSLRTLFAKPLAAAVFLTLNGLILLTGERLRRRPTRALSAAPAPYRQLDRLDYPDAVVIGSSQIGALFAGISRSGITMVTGLLRGLDHEAAAASHSCSPPVILAAGIYKLPDLAGPAGDGIRGQVLVGSLWTRDGVLIHCPVGLIEWSRNRF
jgi:undecaprenyl-diphosphatase